MSKVSLAEPAAGRSCLGMVVSLDFRTSNVGAEVRGRAMKRRDVLRSMAVPLLSGRLCMSSRACDASPNAADLYREAVAKLPPKTEAEDKLLVAAASVPLGREASNCVEQAGPAWSS